MCAKHFQNPPIRLESIESVECVQAIVFAAKMGKPFDTPSILKTVQVSFLNRGSHVQFVSGAPIHLHLNRDCSGHSLATRLRILSRSLLAVHRSSSCSTSACVNGLPAAFRFRFPPFRYAPCVLMLSTLRSLARPASPFCPPTLRPSGSAQNVLIAQFSTKIPAEDHLGF